MNISRKQIFTAVIAALLLFIGGWLIASPVLNFTLEFYRENSRNVCFINNNLGGIFWGKYFMALSLAILPLFAMLFSFLLNRFSSTLSKDRFWFFLVVMLVGYASGHITEMLLGRWSLSYTIDPAIVSTVPVEEVFAYKFSVFVAILFAALGWLFILVRRKSRA